MNKILEKPFLAISILLVLCAYLFFFRLGNMALTDPDETFYAQTAKEMLNRGDWTTPYLYGKPQFEKPIFTYWLVEASYKIFGVNERSARLPSAVFGLLGVIAVYLLGKLLFNKRAGFLSAIILATNVEYLILSRACITDMVLTVLMLAGVLFFFYGYLKEKGYFYILSSAMFGLAVLTKGPIAIILPAVVFVFFLAFAGGGIGKLKKIPFALAFLTFVLVAGPWYLIAYKLHGKEFIDAFFGFQNVTRFMQSEHKIGSQVYYNIPVILAGFFPWSVFLPFGFWHIFDKIRKSKLEIGNSKSGYIFALIWFLTFFLFFTASSTKLPTYVFPCFISLALIVGVLWDDFLDNGKITRSVEAGMKVSYYLLLLAVLAGAVGISLYMKHSNKMPEIFPGVIVSSIVLAAGFIVATAAFVKQKYAQTFLLIVSSLMIFLLPLSLLILPVVEKYETSKGVAQKLSTMMRPDDALGSQSNYLAGLAFYTDKFPVDVDKHQAMVNFFNSEKRIWGVIKSKNHRDLYDTTLNTDYVKPSYLIYTIGKRSIVTNQVPEGVAYILKRGTDK